MPLFDHKDIGDVHEYVYLQGKVTSVYGDDDTVDLEIPESGLTAEQVPLYYHCSNEATLKDNGALEGAASAFAEDDEVIVRCIIKDGANYEVKDVVGFADMQPRPCGLGLFGIVYDHQLFVFEAKDRTLRWEDDETLSPAAAFYKNDFSDKVIFCSCVDTLGVIWAFYNYGEINCDQYLILKIGDLIFTSFVKVFDRQGNYTVDANLLTHKDEDNKDFILTRRAANVERKYEFIMDDNGGYINQVSIVYQVDCWPSRKLTLNGLEYDPVIQLPSREDEFPYPYVAWAKRGCDCQEAAPGYPPELLHYRFYARSKDWGPYFRPGLGTLGGTILSSSFVDNSVIKEEAREQNKIRQFLSSEYLGCCASPGWGLCVGGPNVN